MDKADRISHKKLADEAIRFGRPLSGPSNLDALVERLGQARIVMLGEASHGTEEFYEWRRTISQRLIAEQDFNFIAVEGDWPDAQRLDRYVTRGEGGSARDVLLAFDRWPMWMWANTQIAELAEWMQEWNSSRPFERRARFHGLDIYSLFESIDRVLRQLERLHPFLVRRVRERYECIARFDRDELAYARSTLTYPEGCESAVVQNLSEVLELRLKGAERDDLLDIQQNARVVRAAESYYRAMLHPTRNSWNIRDTHMMDTLDMLLEQTGRRAKAVVWAHNTHVGDYRATDMILDGSVNIGGLARERYGASEVALVGFGTNRGTVIASHAWDGPPLTLEVPPGRPGSYEAGFHEACSRQAWPNFILDLTKFGRIGPLSEVHGHRAIGVVYDPEHERHGNYVPTSLLNRYDAFVFLDETRALTPLHEHYKRHQIPETWPSGQ